MHAISRVHDAVFPCFLHVGMFFFWKRFAGAKGRRAARCDIQDGNEIGHGICFPWRTWCFLMDLLTQGWLLS